MSFQAVQYKLARGRRLAKSLGFVSSIDEDSSGKPAYFNPAPVPDDDREDKIQDIESRLAELEAVAGRGNE
jgi:hypothetical protein